MELLHPESRSNLEKLSQKCLPGPEPHRSPRSDPPTVSIFLGTAKRHSATPIPLPKPNGWPTVGLLAPFTSLSPPSPAVPASPAPHLTFVKSARDEFEEGAGKFHQAVPAPLRAPAHGSRERARFSPASPKSPRQLAESAKLSFVPFAAAPGRRVPTLSFQQWREQPRRVRYPALKAQLLPCPRRVPSTLAEGWWMPRRVEQPEEFSAAPRFAHRLLGQWKCSKECGEQHGRRGARPSLVGKLPSLGSLVFGFSAQLVCLLRNEGSDYFFF